MDSAPYWDFYVGATKAYTYSKQAGRENNQTEERKQNGRDRYASQVSEEPESLMSKI